MRIKLIFLNKIKKFEDELDMKDVAYNYFNSFNRSPAKFGNRINYLNNMSES